MKKAYINPEMETVDLKMNCVILTGSKIPTAGGTPSEWGAPQMDWDDDFDEE